MDPKALETLNSSDDNQSRPASPRLEDLLDEAAGGQSDPEITPANRNGGNELELGQMTELPTNRNGTELGHVSENMTNHRIESQVEQDNGTGMYRNFLNRT